MFLKLRGTSAKVSVDLTVEVLSAVGCYGVQGGRR